MQTLLFIGSPGHTGSTVLDLLLGNHPKTVSLGELIFFDRFVSDPDATCTCGLHVTECDFWNRVLKQMRTASGRESLAFSDVKVDIHRPPAELHRRSLAVRDVVRLIGSHRIWDWATRISKDCAREEATNAMAELVYDAACNVSGADTVVDSSKAPGSLKNRYLRFGDRFRLVFQTRDGRAVAASQIRRDSSDMETAALDWKRRNLNQLYVAATIPRRQKLRVRYEDLCRDPEQALREITDFAGLAEPVTDMSLRKSDAHNISGNDHRFRRDEITIKYDERWRDELSPSQLRTFDGVAGRLNRYLGYR